MSTMISTGKQGKFHYLILQKKQKYSAQIFYHNVEILSQESQTEQKARCWAINAILSMEGKHYET